MATDSDSGYYCMSKLGIEITVYIITWLMLWGAFFSTSKLRHQSKTMLLSPAFNLFLALLSYTFSQTKHTEKQGISRVRVHLILTWMALAEIIRQQKDDTSTGKALPVTTYTRKSFASMEQLARIGWVGYLVYTYARIQLFSITLMALCASSIAYEVLMYFAFIQGKGSYFMKKYPEIIGSHVKRVLLQDNVPTTLDNCGYIVLGEEAHEIKVFHNGYQIADMEGLLTIGHVFQQRSSEENKAFTSAHPHWRDICLSFALAKMLRRRFARLPLDEAGSSKACDFVLKWLNEYIGRNGDLQRELCLRGGVEENIPQEESNRENKPTERIFEILNVELKFVSEFLHSKVLMYQFFQWVLYVDIAFSLILVGAFIALVPWAFVWSVRSKIPFFHKEDVLYCGSVLFNYVLTVIDSIIVVILFVVSTYLQVVKYTGISARWKTLRIISTHVKISAQLKEPKIYRSFISCNLASTYFRHISELLRMIPKLTRTTGQHSVFDIEARNNFCTKAWRYIVRMVEPPEITVDVKKAIVKSFMESSGRLTRPSNWACQPNGSITEAILVWHIATTLFNHQKPPPEEGGDPFKMERGVASTLSKYCHYLVASLPGLLPDEVEWTEKMYGDLKEEIVGVDSSCGLKSSSRCDRVLQKDWAENSVVGKGVSLAKELMRRAENQENIWKMLADFWVEMMLFIAPSENVEAHEEILDRREFITQIWALLTHAGILTRPKPSESGNASV